MTLHRSSSACCLSLPALATIALLFAYPLAYSVVTAFEADGEWGFANFVKAYELYRAISCSRC